ncbi:uncharacterized protein LOC112094473 [Morus notabilis]|uniref:uncharacterized protein LOC112094473 n=1 Tax=Morus notabilis TaxID=981085 RepID=UPI000CECFD6B|nr:uncharacterized protein LOC112094473 [Morus notabilis]
MGIHSGVGGMGWWNNIAIQTFFFIFSILFSSFNREETNLGAPIAVATIGAPIIVVTTRAPIAVVTRDVLPPIDSCLLTSFSAFLHFGSFVFISISSLDFNFLRSGCSFTGASISDKVRSRLISARSGCSFTGASIPGKVRSRLIPARIMAH